MKKTLYLTAVALMLSVGAGAEVNASPLLEEKSNFVDVNQLQLEVIVGALMPDVTDEKENTIEIEVKEVEEVAPEPVVYTVVEGDSLIKIAQKHDVKWQRIWAKNKKLKHQDRLNVGFKLVIPHSDEDLKDRPLVIPAVVETPVREPVVRSNEPVTVVKPVSSGNTYSYGYCTYYVKNRRPDIPNGLGNANTWYYRASAMGLPVGSEPRVGAVATTTAGGLGHVAYVEKVNGNGTVVVSEMNYQGWGVVSSRTTSASEFLYIY